MGGGGQVHGVVKKWGNSATVRIPAAVLEAAHVCLDQPADVREEGGRIVIEPLRPARYEGGWRFGRRIGVRRGDFQPHVQLDMGFPHACYGLPQGITGG
jgi:hypothetical protein